MEGRSGSSFGPCGTWPAESAWIDADYWPAILVNGSVRLPDSGRGTLLVTGDRIVRGGDTWAGLIMVGNRIVDNGPPICRGDLRRSGQPHHDPQ